MFYYVGGWVVCLICLFILIPEVIIDIGRGRSKTSNIVSKFFGLAFCIFRIVDYAIWAQESITEDFQSTALASIFIFYIAELLALCCYASIIVTWISLYVGIINVSKQKSKYFKRAQRLVQFFMCFYLILQFVFKILSFLGIASSLNDALYMVLTIVYIAVLAGWSTYHSVRIILEYRNNYNTMITPQVKIFLWKNNLIIVMNCLFLIFIITMALYVVLDVRSSPWKYLIFMSLFRAQEWVILGLAIAVMQIYWSWRHPIDHWKEKWFEHTKRNITTTEPPNRNITNKEHQNINISIPTV